MKVRFERGEAISSLSGPTTVEYEFNTAWVQITYNELRVGEDGETLAVCLRDVWYLQPNLRLIEKYPQLENWTKHQPFTDVVIGEW